MSDVDRDPLVRRAIDELRKTPRADHETVARVVAAAAAARVTPADDEPTLPDRARRARLWTLGGVAAAAAVAGFALSSANGVRRERAAMAAAAAAPVANAPAPEFQPVGSNSADGLPVLRQFVFHSRTAHSVRFWPLLSASMIGSSSDSFKLQLKLRSIFVTLVLSTSNSSQYNAMLRAARSRTLMVLSRRPFSTAHMETRTR